MTKILVIGANGQLGKCFQYWSQDFTDFQFFLKTFGIKHFKPQTARVFFSIKNRRYSNKLSAYTAVDEAENHSEEAEKLNSDAVYALCKFSKNYGFKLIFPPTMFLTDQPLNPTKKVKLSTP